MTELSQTNILSWVLFLPLTVAALVAVLPSAQKALLRWTAFLGSVAVFVVSLWLWFCFTPGEAGMQFVINIPWIDTWGVSYHLGIDGISVLLILLTTFLSPVVILSTWAGVDDKVKAFLILLLVLETGMLGAFMALDLVLFYFFWEVMLIPMYLLIGVWGHERRIYAAVKFILYTMVGSLLMLVGFIYLVWIGNHSLGYFTTDLLQLYRVAVPYHAQFWLFASFALAFAIKVPIFPFHTWLPDAHVEAPAAGSVILAGVLLKMGTYGFLRFAMPLFPAASHTFTPLFMTLAVIGIIYGALVAMVQPDLKKLVAYSSVSHLGFVMLGLFSLTSAGITGGVYQMLNHGISTGALFLIVGILYERRHTRLIDQFGGLSAKVPVLAAFFMVATLSSIGLPGLNGFVGEFLILLGAFGSAPVYVYFAASGVILAAVYMLWMFRRVMFGPLDNPQNQKMADLSFREVMVLLPLTVMMFWMGMFPGMFLDRISPSVEKFIDNYQQKLELAETMHETVTAGPLDGRVVFDRSDD